MAGGTGGGEGGYKAENVKEQVIQFSSLTADWKSPDKSLTTDQRWGIILLLSFVNHNEKGTVLFSVNVKLFS